MEIEKLKLDFFQLEESIKRAKLVIEVTYPSNELIEVATEITLYELIKSSEKMIDMVREIDPKRFGVRTEMVRQLIIPKPDIENLNLCPYCGEHGCGSDHK